MVNHLPVILILSFFNCIQLRTLETTKPFFVFFYMNAMYQNWTPLNFFYCNLQKIKNTENRLFKTLYTAGIFELDVYVCVHVCVCVCVCVCV